MNEFKKVTHTFLSGRLSATLIIPIDTARVWSRQTGKCDSRGKRRWHLHKEIAIVGGNYQKSNRNEGRTGSRRHIQLQQSCGFNFFSKKSKKKVSEMSGANETR